jgi:hypothetical protein
MAVNALGTLMPRAQLRWWKGPVDAVLAQSLAAAWLIASRLTVRVRPASLDVEINRASGVG